MKLYFFATDSGCAEFLFTPSEERAVEVFSIYAVLSEMHLSRFWFREVSPSALPLPAREHLLEALARQVEGFGQLAPGLGWNICSVEDQFDRANGGTGKGNSL